LCLGIGQGVDLDEFVEKQMKVLDKDQDQKVSFDEFVDCYNNLMDLI
jgi:Ca2+-binding EF-hand superfamily protein